MPPVERMDVHYVCRGKFPWQVQSYFLRMPWSNCQQEVLWKIPPLPCHDGSKAIQVRKWLVVSHGAHSLNPMSKKRDLKSKKFQNISYPFETSFTRNHAQNQRAWFREPIFVGESLQGWSQAHGSLEQHRRGHGAKCCWCLCFGVLFLPSNFGWFELQILNLENMGLSSITFCSR